MRHNYFLVALVALTLASSALAADDQVVFNLDPETQSSVSVMSDTDVVGEGPLKSFPSLTVARLPQRAMVPLPEPTVYIPCEGVAMVWATGVVGTTDPFKVAHLFFTYLPAGAEISHWVKKPDGKVFFSESVVLSVGGNHWQGWIWNAPLLADYPAGISEFGSTAKIGAWECTVVAPVAIGMVFPAEGGPQLGPLESFLVDSMRGVRLFGVFKTPAIVVAAPVPEMVPLEGGNYIPPGTVGPGNKVTGVCSGKDGNPNFLECTTETIPFPVF